MSAARAGAAIAIANLAGKTLEKAAADARSREFFGKLRLNIVAAMLLVGIIGMAVSILGNKMINEGLVAEALVGAIVAITTLGGKILEAK